MKIGDLVLRDGLFESDGSVGTIIAETMEEPQDFWIVEWENNGVLTKHDKSLPGLRIIDKAELREHNKRMAKKQILEIIAGILDDYGMELKTKYLRKLCLKLESRVSEP